MKWRGVSLKYRIFWLAFFLLLFFGWEKSGQAETKVPLFIQSKGASAPVYAYVANDMQKVGTIYSGRVFEVVDENKPGVLIIQ